MVYSLFQVCADGLVYMVGVNGVRLARNDSRLELPKGILRHVRRNCELLLLCHPIR